MKAKNKLLTYVLSKLTHSEKSVIKAEQIGLAEMLEDYSLSYYARQHLLEDSGGNDDGDDSEEMVNVDHKSSLFMLMMSKDDNLML